jgi:hypothetical protein
MTQPPHAHPDPDRETLRALLWDACELEHQLMLQYLFAAFTLRKFPEPGTGVEAQLEAVRRWGSTVMLVARQEMEHLALANGILAAIGEDPFFPRDNIPSQTRYFKGENRVEARETEGPAANGPAGGPTPLDIPFVFDRFSVKTMARFVCAESPDWQYVHGTDTYPAWCFASDTPRKGLRARFAAPEGLGPAGLPEARSHVDRLPPRVAGGLLGAVPVHPGTIPELYGKIDALLERHPEYFVGHRDRQVFIPVEYQISVIKITDYATAHAAIDQIIEEGEGIDAPPGYESHFARFFAVHQEVEALVAAGFDPALPVHRNPVPGRGWLRYTREVSEVFDYAYVTLLYVLTSLYRNYARRERTPFLTEALQNVAFGPFMTMIVRPIAEVLVHLRVRRGKGETAGPAFRITPEEELMIWPRPPAAGPPHSHAGDEKRERMAERLDNIDFILERLDELCERLGRLAGSGDRKRRPPRALTAALVEGAPPEWARQQLDYVRESAQAMANNVRRIYQIGELPQFTVPVEWPQ